jgi:hypothetical protein
MFNSSKKRSNSFKLKLGVWLFALILLTPVLLLNLAHFITPKGIPTGFIQMDTPSYVANGREHFDGETFTFFYPNPYSIASHSTPIYFQPHIFLIGFLVWLTQINPGIIFCIFGFFAALLCFRVLIAVFEDLFGLDSFFKWLTIPMLCWGGGITFLMGFTATLLQEKNVLTAIKNAFRFDTNEGWGFTNFGRNLISPMEAYYHLLAMLVVWSVFKKNHLLTCALLTFFSISHPFTGLQMILIVLCWQIFEAFYLKDQTIKLQYIFFNVLLTGFHLAYYLLFLGRDAEHKSVTAQWATYDAVEKMDDQAINFVPACILVFLLFAYQIRTPEKFISFFQNQKYRFLAIFGLVSFVLANHEFAVDPMQPIHFDRGYIWFPLFLLGTETLLSMLNYLKTKMKLLGIIVIFCLFTVMVSDNLGWFPIQYNNFYKGNGFVLSKDDKDVIDFIKQNKFNKKFLLISNENRLSYLMATYTPVRTLIGHPINSPFWLENNKIRADFFKTGVLPEQILLNNILILVKKDTEAEGIGNFPKEQIYENDSFVIYKRFGSNDF